MWRARATHGVDRAFDHLGSAPRARHGGRRAPAPLLGALSWRSPVTRRAWVMDVLEPALAAGIVIVIGYGLSGRLLPGLIHLAHSTHAGGSSSSRSPTGTPRGRSPPSASCSAPAWRATQPATLAPLRCRGRQCSARGGRVHLVSRGAIAAAALGWWCWWPAMPARAQLRAAALVLVMGVVTAAVSAAFPGRRLPRRHPRRARTRRRDHARPAPAAGRRGGARDGSAVRRRARRRHARAGLRGGEAAGGGRARHRPARHRRAGGGVACARRSRRPVRPGHRRGSPA